MIWNVKIVQNMGEKIDLRAFGRNIFHVSLQFENIFRYYNLSINEKRFSAYSNYEN